jgi:hypothetical protein
MKMDYNACFTIIYTQQIHISHLLKKVRKNNKVIVPTLLLFWLLWMKLREHMRRWRVGPPIGVSWLAGHESLTHLSAPTIVHRCCCWLSTNECSIGWNKNQATWCFQQMFTVAVVGSQPSNSRSGGQKNSSDVVLSFVKKCFGLSLC